MIINYLISIILIEFAGKHVALCFVPTSYHPFSINRNSPVLSLAQTDSAGTELDKNQELLGEIRSMRVKDLKNELSKLRITTTDVFEKEELVQRLYQAKQKAGNSILRDDNDVIRAPLDFTTMDSGTSVSINTGEYMTINPFVKPYPSIKIQLDGGYKLNLLLDTACSGLVLKPSVIRNYGLPTYNTSVTMTAAGGTTSNTGLTQISKFFVGGKSFGPLPAAVQDISGLPSSLDGIMGLSFLSQFECVELDFANQSLILYKNGRKKSEPKNLSIVAEATMSLTRLGIWITDVYLDGRGPVKMLVDTGAASSILNWRGVKNLDLARDSLIKIDQPIGAMGADNIAMELSYRFVASKSMNFCDQGYEGLSLKDSVDVDVGDIAVLHTLQSDGVGGILGADLLLQCSVARFVMKGSNPKITLYA